MRRYLPSLEQIKRYPSLAAGLIIILIMIIVSVYTVIAIPYGEAVRQWQDPGERVGVPRLARPVWFDWVTSDRIPRTLTPGLSDEGAELTEELIGGGMKLVTVTIPFEYNFDGLPPELHLVTSWRWETDVPRMSVYWSRPDGEVITLTENLTTRRSHTYRIDKDAALRVALGGVLPQDGLFAVDYTVPQDELQPLHGSYSLILRSELPENDELRNANLVVYGHVHGWAGTDNQRRDLLLPLLWGAPIALAFGILAAIGAQVSTFVLAGISTWFGGKLEKIFQWLTQVNIIVPVLPILIMISHFYSPRIWTILGLVIAMNVFSASMMTYRAMFLQLKEAPYIEAAQAYGAGNRRIIFRYLLPRIAPTLLPQFVMIVPSFVFLEATLAVLNLGDPFLPTWGKVLNDAYRASALQLGHYYWILQPSILLMTIGLGFALVGFALDRIFNPRLRTI